MKNSIFRVFFIPTTRKQRINAKKSREADMSSDIENLDIMLRGNRVETEESEFSNSVRRPESPTYDALVNHGTMSHTNAKEDEIKGYTGKGHNSREVDSSSEFNKLSGELNQRITQ